MQRNSKLWLGAGLALVLFTGAAFSLLFDIFARVPDFNELKKAVKVPIMLKDGSKATKWVGPKASGWTPMRDVSNHLLMAVIASEDTSFFSHDGIDMHEIKEAIRKDIKEKKWARGASTITQQVVKNVFLSQEKTLMRKVREIFWARELDKALSKHELLCFYVNLVEFGPGIYGVRDAAKYYFNSEPADLTVRQSAFLAMMLPSPRKYHVYFVKRQLSAWAEKRVEQILRVMNNMSFIDSNQYEDALGEKLWANEKDSLPGSGSELDDKEEEERIDREERNQSTPAIADAPLPNKGEVSEADEKEETSEKNMPIKKSDENVVPQNDSNNESGDA